jgi:YD repeat-containing protein
MNLMEFAERDLAVTLESSDGWGTPVTITRKSDGHTQTDLRGQVLKDSVKINEEGEPIIDHTPLVSLRVSSLTVVPVDSEIWYFDIPTKLNEPSGATTRYVYDPDGAKRGFHSIGVNTYPLKLYEDERP